MPRKTKIDIAAPQSSTNRARQVVLEWIIQNEIQPGRQLPPQATLVKQLSCSETTVQKAMQQLVNEGVVRRQVGQGSFLVKLPDNLDPNTPFIEAPSVSKKTLKPKMLMCSIDAIVERNNYSPVYEIINAAEQYLLQKFPQAEIQLCTITSMAQLLALIEKHQPMGVLLDWRSREHLVEFKNQTEYLGLPVVHCFQTYLPNLPLKHQVCMDDHRIGELAIQHLYQLGHRHMAIGLNPEALKSPERFEQQRYNGALNFVTAFAAQGLQLMPLQAKPIEPKWTWEQYGADIFQQWNALKSNRPTAIFALNDEMALGIVQAAESCSVRIPEDLALIGVDNHVGVRVRHGISLSTLDPQRTAIGEMAIDKLLDMISNSETVSSSITRVSPRLITRQTTQIRVS